MSAFIPRKSIGEVGFDCLRITRRTQKKIIQRRFEGKPQREDSKGRLLEKTLGENSTEIRNERVSLIKEREPQFANLQHKTFETKIEKAKI